MEANECSRDIVNSDDEESIRSYTEDDSSIASPAEDFISRKQQKQTNSQILDNNSVLSKINAIEGALDYLQKELRDSAGSLGEIEIGFCHTKRIPMMTSLQGGSSDSEGGEPRVSTIWIDNNGHGLLPFTQACLQNPKYSNIIRWTREPKDLEFKVVDPNKFALMWGKEKRKEHMNKRKLTRSFGYLVRKGRLRRSISRTFVYTILPESDQDIPTPSDVNSNNPVKNETNDNKTQITTEMVKKIISSELARLSGSFSEPTTPIYPNQTFPLLGSKRPFSYPTTPIGYYDKTPRNEVPSITSSQSFGMCHDAPSPMYPPITSVGISSMSLNASDNSTTFLDYNQPVLQLSQDSNTSTYDDNGNNNLNDIQPTFTINSSTSSHNQSFVDSLSQSIQGYDLDLKAYLRDI